MLSNRLYRSKITGFIMSGKASPKKDKAKGKKDVVQFVAYIIKIATVSEKYFDEKDNVQFIAVTPTADGGLHRDGTDDDPYPHMDVNYIYLIWLTDKPFPAGTTMQEMLQDQRGESALTDIFTHDLIEGRVIVPLNMQRVDVPQPNKAEVHEVYDKRVIGVISKFVESVEPNKKHRTILKITENEFPSDNDYAPW